MAHLRDSSSTSELRAITINGCIHVESDEDVARRREQRRKERKSRWGHERVVNAPDSQLQHKKQVGLGATVKKSNILLGPDDVYQPEEASSSSSSANTVVGIQLPTMINASAMDEKKQQIYFCQMAIQEATVKLGRPDLGKQLYLMYLNMSKRETN